MFLGQSADSHDNVFVAWRLVVCGLELFFITAVWNNIESSAGCAACKWKWKNEGWMHLTDLYRIVSFKYIEHALPLTANLFHSASVEGEEWGKGGGRRMFFGEVFIPYALYKLPKTFPYHLLFLIGTQTGRRDMSRHYHLLDRKLNISATESKWNTHWVGISLIYATWGRVPRDNKQEFHYHFYFLH